MNILAKSVLLVFLTAIASAAIAESDSAIANPGHPLLNNTWDFWAGGFFPSVDSEIRLDSSLGSPGDGIDLEDDFGLDDGKTVLWGGARWHFLTRHLVEIEVANLNRSATVGGTTREWDIGDNTYRAGARIDSEFDLALIRATYGYSIFRRPKHELSLKAGFHMTHTRIAIRGFGDVANVDTGQPVCNPSPCEVEAESSDFTIPLPHLGAAYGYGFTPKLALRSQLLLFAIEINDIKGTLAEVDLDLIYRPWEHVAFGAGIRYFKVTVEDKRNAFLRGEFEYEYKGPVLYVMGSF